MCYRGSRSTKTHACIEHCCSRCSEEMQIRVILASKVPKGEPCKQNKNYRVTEIEQHGQVCGRNCWLWVMKLPWNPWSCAWEVMGDSLVLSMVAPQTVECPWVSLGLGSPLASPSLCFSPLNSVAWHRGFLRLRLFISKLLSCTSACWTPLWHSSYHLPRIASVLLHPWGSEGKSDLSIDLLQDRLI